MSKNPCYSKNMRWDESETYHFVKIYMNNENLWNPDHENYRSKNERIKSYNNIISDFNTSTGISLSPKDLKNKIKNLRSTYAQEVAKIKQRSGPDYIYKPNLKWFSEMHKHLEKISRYRVENSVIETSVDETCDNTYLGIQDIDEIDVQEDFVSDSGNDYFITLKKEAQDADQEVDTLEICKIKRMKQKHENTNSAESVRSSRNSLDLVGSSSREDEYDIYGKFIASQLRSMDLQKALKLQLQIHSLVSKARISDICDN